MYDLHSKIFLDIYSTYIMLNGMVDIPKTAMGEEVPLHEMLWKILHDIYPSCCLVYKIEGNAKKGEGESQRCDLHWMILHGIYPTTLLTHAMGNIAKKAMGKV